MAGKGFGAIQWARELPTLLRHGRVDRDAHLCAVLLATYADNDGANIWVSTDTLSGQMRLSPKATAAVLDRLQTAAVIRPEKASNGVPGWALTMTDWSVEKDVLEARAERTREVDRLRQKRKRDRDRHGGSDRDVTHDGTVTGEEVSRKSGTPVTHHTTVTDAGVTQECTVSHAQETVTRAGHTGSTSLDLPTTDDLPTNTSHARERASDPDEHDDEPSEQGELIHFPCNGKTKKQRVEEEFDSLFWPPYPKKESKDASRAKWRVARETTDADTILAGLNRAIEHWRREGTARKFIPLASSWLHQGRWKDQLGDGDRAAVNGAPFRSSASDFQADKMGRFAKRDH